MSRNVLSGLQLRLHNKFKPSLFVTLLNIISIISTSKNHFKDVSCYVLASSLTIYTNTDKNNHKLWYKRIEMSIYQPHNFSELLTKINSELYYRIWKISYYVIFFWLYDEGKENLSKTFRIFRSSHPDVFFRKR